MARAERHQLLCQLPTAPGQGWPAGSCSAAQEQWSHRHGWCDVQGCRPRELCLGLSPGVLEFISVDAAVLYCSSASHSFSSASVVTQARLLLPSPCIAVCKYWRYVRGLFNTLLTLPPAVLRPAVLRHCGIIEINENFSGISSKYILSVESVWGLTWAAEMLCLSKESMLLLEDCKILPVGWCAVPSSYEGQQPRPEHSKVVCLDSVSIWSLCFTCD